MKPVKTLANTLSTLLAADTTYLANATPMKVSIISADFSESLDRVIGDLTLETASPLAPIAGVAGAQETGVDPLTKELLIEIKTPVGGFRWDTGSGFAGPKTIFGLALTNGAVSALLGTVKLASPLVLTGDHQTYTAPPLVFRIDPSKIS